MNAGKWIDQHIKDNWHNPETRAGVEKGKRMLEENLGRKLPDRPLIAELKAQDKDFEKSKDRIE